MWFAWGGPKKNLLIGAPFHPIYTLPKTNSSHLKIGRNPIGKDRIPTIHFQGLLLLVSGRVTAFRCPPCIFHLVGFHSNQEGQLVTVAAHQMHCCCRLAGYGISMLGWSIEPRKKNGQIRIPLNPACLMTRSWNNGLWNNPQYKCVVFASPIYPKRVFFIAQLHLVYDLNCNPGMAHKKINVVWYLRWVQIRNLNVTPPN